VDAHGTFEVGDWVQVFDPCRENHHWYGRWGRVEQIYPFTHYTHLVEFVPGSSSSPKGRDRWDTFRPEELRAFAPTEEMLATWMIEELSQ
jgi:hypothetical protein